MRCRGVWERRLATAESWRFAPRQVRTAAAEYRSSLSRHAYLRLVQRYCPDLTPEDLRPHPAGIRAQALAVDGSLVEDFRVERTARQLHVLNAPSPAATSALPIAGMIVDAVDGAAAA